MPALFISVFVIITAGEFVYFAFEGFLNNTTHGQFYQFSEEVFGLGFFTKVVTKLIDLMSIRLLGGILLFGMGSSPLVWSLGGDRVSFAIPKNTSCPFL